MNNNSAVGLEIRLESTHDYESIHRLLAAAFPQDLEARLVDRLRLAADPWLALVAEVDKQVVGHIAFSPVTVRGNAFTVTAWGLGPMAVLPERQRQGIGSRLVESGLAECRHHPLPAVFVLGHADYYPRFGFQPAAGLGLRYKGPEFEPYFFVLENRPGELDSLRGEVEYHPEFDAV